jgi:hypothetical protein
MPRDLSNKSVSLRSDEYRQPKKTSTLCDRQAQKKLSRGAL